jgi:hypothetical protein
MGATMALAFVVKNPNSSCSPSTSALFGPRTPRQRVRNPVKANGGRSSLSANHVGVLRGFVSAYSQNDVAGTRQRFLAESQPRQCRLATLLMLVTSWPPNCSGPGMPQRAMTSSRSPSALLRTIGASWSRKIPGMPGGRQPCPWSDGRPILASRTARSASGRAGQVGRGGRHRPQRSQGEHEAHPLELSARSTPASERDSVRISGASPTQGRCASRICTRSGRQRWSQSR